MPHLRPSVLILLLLFLPLSASQDCVPVISAAAIRIGGVCQADTERDWAVEMVLVNFDSSVIVESALLSSLPTLRQHTTALTEIVYNIDYQVTYASEEYEQMVKTVILDNSVVGNATGTRLDEDALLYQSQHPDLPQRVFYPRAGRSIDADALELWLIDNPAVEPPGLGYTFYLLNFSEFDSGDEEHWFDYGPIDPDSGQRQDWFRLEWDNSLNPDVVFEYPGFGGKRGNIYVLDPSADQWYLKWASIWWQDENIPPYTEHDLEAYASTLDLSIPQDRVELSEYLGQYAYDVLAYLLFPFQHEPTAYVQSGLLKTLVFCMDVDEGVSVESLNWVTDADLLTAHLDELLPFIPWTVEVEFIDIDDSPPWNDLFWEYAYVDDGVVWADGYGMFEAIYTQMRPEYIDVTDSDINVFGVVFVKKNMVMYTPGGTFTGLGGGGQTVIWKSWERYYREDGVTPKSGVSLTQLHETMHAVGILHTWDYEHYVGDFSSSPMGYYASHNGTSVYDRNWVQSTYLDQMEADYYTRYLFILDEIAEQMSEKTEMLSSRVLSAFERAQDAYCHMEWAACYEALMEASGLTDRMMYSALDSEPPEVRYWGIEEAGLSSDVEFSVWATVSDDLSGVENVTAVLEVNDTITYFECEYVGGNWSVDIPAFESVSTSRVAVRIEAVDIALNRAETDWVIVRAAERGWLPLIDPVSMGVVALASMSVIAVLFVVMRRRGFRAHVLGTAAKVVAPGLSVN